VNADDYHRRLAQLGLDPSFHVVDNSTEMAREMAKAPSLGLTLKADRTAREAEARHVQREKDLAAGAVDARTATPEQVQARIESLLGDQRDRPILDGAFREIGEPLPPRKEPPPPVRAADAAEKRVRYMVRSGQKIDARRLTDEQHAALLRAHGLDVPGSWGPGTRPPPRR
jgi:hypothetical protein